MSIRDLFDALRPRARRDAELDEEIRAHLAMAARDRVARGAEASEAAYAARREFGNVGHVRELTREMWAGGSFERLAHDARLALRALRRAPVFTLTAVLTLALGIGLTTTIFSVVNGVVLRPLPFPDADRLMVLCEHYPSAIPDWCSTTPPNVEDIRARSSTIAATGIARWNTVRLTTVDGPRLVNSAIATAGAFRALGVQPARGRFLTDADLLVGAAPVVVIAHAFWQARFGGSPDVIGRRIILDKKTVTIVGVMPTDFAMPKIDEAELYQPVDLDPRDEQNRAWRGFVAYVRLKSGVTYEAAAADLQRVTSGIAREHFATTPGWSITLRPLHDFVVGSMRRTLLLFMTAVLLVLLVACANVANLVLARGASRQREIALRAALGAGRARLLRGLLLEDLILSFMGASVGVLLAVAGVRVFRALAPTDIPRLESVHVDAPVLAFTLVLSIATTLVFGIIPSWRGANVDPTDGLRDSGRAYTRRSRFGSALVVGELALALMLLTGATLLTRTFTAISAWSPGFDESHLLVFSLSTTRANYADAAGVRALWNRSMDAVRSVPGVAGVGTASGGPLFGGMETADVQSGTGDGGGAAKSVRWFDVSSHFFTALGVPILRGRDFDERDVPGGAAVALINETLARQQFGGADPVGRRITLVLHQHELPYGVIGVVRDVPPLIPGTLSEPQLYWSNQQQPRWFTYVVVRTTVSPLTTLRAIRARLKLVDPELQPGNVATMTDIVARKLVTPRFMMVLLATFGLAALALAAIGTYGLLAYVVSQRKREIGVRLALGARPGRVVRDVLGAGMRLAIAGAIIGIAGSLLLGRTLEHFVAGGVSTHDPVALGGAAVVLLGAALAACLLPSLRASRIDPMSVMSSD